MHMLRRDHLLSLVNGPIIWMLHFVLCYALVSLICAWNLQRRLFGLDMSQLGVGALTLLALALLAAGVTTNYRKWRQTRRGSKRANSLSAFFALVTLMLCGLSAVAVVWVAMPMLMLTNCVI